MKPLGKYLVAVFLAVALVSAVGCASTPKQEATGEYIDDGVIISRVKEAMLDEPTLTVAEVNVERGVGERLREFAACSEQGSRGDPRGRRRETRQERLADQMSDG